MILGLSLLASSAINSVDQQQAISISGIISDVKVGTKIGSKHAGLACLPDGAMRWESSSLNASSERAIRALQQQGYQIPNDPGKAFGLASTLTPYILLGKISAIRLNVCYTHTAIGGSDSLKVKGQGSVGVDWQVYSRAAKAVVLSTHTDTELVDKIIVDDGVAGLVGRLVEDAANQLGAKPEFKSVITAKH